MSLKYRPEVDGLRAIAVCAVVLYHAEFIFLNVNPFVGGYIGVDVFFVISGYLITSIILREMNEGRFSFASFYERRARRILPALFTVMLTSIPFAWMHMRPKAMQEYAGSILSSLAFSSNIWFWQEDSYWAEPSALKPFLHTWSLSVEEQFYLLFPIILLLLVKFLHGHLKKFFISLFFASLLLANFCSYHYADAAFYLLPTRAWEIFAGVLLAQIEIDKGRINHPLLNVTMPAVGLLLVCTSIVFFDDQTLHPSFITLIPILGTMLLIWFCRKGEIITGLLSSKAFVGVGIISYGFYLWHFPVFAFAAITGASSTQYDKAVWIALSLILSIATYFLIEKPARNRQKLKIKIFIPFILLPCLILLISQTVFYKTDGAEFRLDRFAKIVDTNYWSEEKNNREKFRTHYGCWMSTDSNIHGVPFDLCESKENLNKNGLIMVIGDSNAAAIVPGLISRFGRDAIVQRVANSCAPNKYSPIDICRQTTKAAIQDMNELNPDLVILGWRYKEYKDTHILRDLLDNDLKPFRDKIIVLGPLPRWNHLPNQLHELFKHDPIHFETPERLAPLPVTFQLEYLMEKVAKEKGVAYLSPVKTFCDEGKCLVKVGNKPDDITAWDAVHLTSNASLFLVEQNKEQINAFINK